MRSGSRPLLTAADPADLTARTAEPLLLLDEVTCLLERLATERPILIGMDDAHWSDPVSRSSCDPCTIGSHLRSVFAKLGVQSRVQLSATRRRSTRSAPRSAAVARRVRTASA